MTFIDLTTKYKITRDKVTMALCTVSVILVCACAVIGISAILDVQAAADRERRNEEAQRLLAETTVTEYIEETEETSSDTEETSLAAVISSTEGSSETDETSDESTEETTETEEVTETTETTAATESTVGESELYMRVYASQSVNLRSGPGTSYDVVRTLSAGDEIDVVAQTSNGWYRTYNGNYVNASYTQTQPLVTPTPFPAQTQATTASTTAATQSTTASTTASTTSSSSGSTPSGMTLYGSCTITFYGPQPLGDGTYSTATATGTTCSEGRTVAADWGIFPAGTTIYIENDPLGGDGYYTVEDRGSGVNGSHIDIYADDGESYSTTSRNVYIVN